MFKRTTSFVMAFIMVFSVLQIIPFKGMNYPVKVFAEASSTNITKIGNEFDRAESYNPAENLEKINDTDMDNELEMIGKELKEISSIEITNMYVAPNKLELYVDGPSDKLTAAVYIKGDSEGQVVKDDNQPITWESDDEDVVKVGVDGTLTPIGVGSTTVTATAESGDTAVCEITVTELDGETGLLVNSSFAEGSLKDHSTFDGKDLDKITKLVIGTGTVNAVDLTWIKKLSNLEELEIIGDAMPPSTGYDKWENKVKKITLYNVTSLGGSAFQESENIEYIYCRDVKSIGIRVFAMKQFQQTSKLHTIRLPKLENTSYRTWYYNSSLETLELGPNAPKITRDEGKEGLYFSYASTDITIVVPDKAAYDDYMDIENCGEIDWSAFVFKALNGEELPLIEKADPYNDSDYDYLREEYAEKNVPYNKADIPIGLNFYTFSKYMSVGQTTWVVPPVTGEWTKPTGDNITILEVIRWAKDVGFDAVDVTGYYLPGYSNTDMPTAEQQKLILQRAVEIKQYAEDVGIAISGTGIQNSFTDPSDARRAKDVERIKFYLDVAEAMGAPCLRIFAGTPPPDVGRQGWESIINNRLVPAIQESADYAKEKKYKVMLGVQTHGDILATGNQALYAYKMINRDNVGIINDTGYYHGFLDLDTDKYDWYTDIANVIPVSTNFQLKKKPAGAGTSAGWLDLERLFKDIRNSSYKNSVPIEMLWGGKGLESDYPDGAPDSDTLGNLTLSRVYNETEWYLGLVKAAMEETKNMAPTYKVSFESNGGSSVASVDVESGDYVSKPVTPIKANNTFIGWYMEDTLSNLFNFTDTRITADIKLYARWKENTSGSSDGSGGNDTVTSTNGELTVPAGKSGKVSLGDAVNISIPANATGKELKLTIEKVLNTEGLLTDKDVLASSIYEILKNFSENFNKAVTLDFAFDRASMKGGQRAAIFYYDEVKKEWVEVAGSKVNGDRISVEVDHFTKFAVFFVDQAEKPETEQPKPVVRLSDIAGHWAEANIKQAVSSGIVNGYPDGTFKPNHTVTRAEFTVMLMNTLNPQGEGAALPFTDAAKIGSWAQKAVSQAFQAGIIKGYEDGSFRPNAEITRAEMAVMIANAWGLNIEANAVTGFADNKDVPTWAKGAVAAMKNQGIINGKGGNVFAPMASTTRAEAVTVLMNMLARDSK